MWKIIMFKLIPTIFLGLALILGFLVNPVSANQKSEVIPFNDLMSLMENKEITYTGSSHDDRPMKVTKKNGKWQMEQTEAGEVSEIISAEENRIEMEDYPSNWIINGTWTFSKSGTKCQINHTDKKELEMYWKC